MLYMLGGWAPNYYDALETDGHTMLKDFVAQGGGFVGICAGAYYGSEWGIGLIDVKVFDIDHWNRGTSDACHIKYTKEAASLVGEGFPLPD